MSLLRSPLAVAALAVVLGGGAVEGAPTDGAPTAPGVATERLGEAERQDEPERSAQGRAPARSERSAPTYERFEFSEIHMAMRVRIVLYAPDRGAAADAAGAAFARIAALEDILSDYRPASELRRLEARPGEWVPVSEELFTVVEAAVEVARLSGGAFDPTVGPLTRLWREARRDGHLPPPAALDSARALTGWEGVGLDPAARAIRLDRPGLALDLGGIAKGYILDEALRAAREAGVERVLLEAGGDVRAGAPPPAGSEASGPEGAEPEGWRIRLGPEGAAEATARGPALDPDAGRDAGADGGGEHADEGLQTGVPPVALLRDAALATSGGSAQFLEVDGIRYSHILDPRTGVGVTHDLTLRVTAPEGLVADALATALSVLEPEEGGALLEHFPEARATVQRPGEEPVALPGSAALR